MTIDLTWVDKIEAEARDELPKLDGIANADTSPYVAKRRAWYNGILRLCEIARAGADVEADENFCWIDDAAKARLRAAVMALVQEYGDERIERAKGVRHNRTCENLLAEIEGRLRGVTPSFASPSSPPASPP